MKLTETYVVGELEHIGQDCGRIAVRMKNCGPKVMVYRCKEIENLFEGKIYGEFSEDEIKLSHSLISFVEGDKVKLIRHYSDDDEKNDWFSLKNLTLSSPKLGNFDELKPKTGEKPFIVSIKGTLKHIEWNRKMVALRLKCSEKKYIFFDENNKQSDKKEAFEREFYGEISRKKLRLDLCIDTTAAYKKGDKVCLSLMVDDGSYDFDNLTLSIDDAESNYKTQLDL